MVVVYFSDLVYHVVTRESLLEEWHCKRVLVDTYVARVEELMALKTVAVLDDDPALIELYRTILQEEGYRFVPISYTSDFASLMRSIWQANADLLILDIRIPGVDSFEVIEALETTSKVKKPKILVCSASRNEIKAMEQKLHESALAVPTILEKPFDLDDFVTQVQSLLG